MTSDQTPLFSARVPKFLWLVFALVVAGFASGVSAESYTDPDGLITFEVPDAWTFQSDSRGTRFRRAAGKERSMLSVMSKQGPDETDLEALRAIRHSQVRSQSRTVITDSVRSENGIVVWEFAAEPGSAGRGPISHSIHLLSEDLRIEVMLIAMPDRYPAYTGDLQSVVDSVAAGLSVQADLRILRRP